MVPTALNLNEYYISCRLWHWTSVCTLLFEGPINLVAPYDNPIINQIKVRSFPKAQGSLCNTVCVFGCMVFDQYCLVHGSHLEQRIFAVTKWLGRYQVQASRFMAKVIVLVIINTMISNDWKIGIMEESKKSQYKYYLIVKNRDIFKGGGVDNYSLEALCN